MIKFRHRNMNPGIIPAPAGTATEPELMLNTEGCGKLEKVGERRSYELIQSYKQETDINYLVQRYMAGDNTVLQRVQGLYTDITDAPESLIEAQERIKTAERIYNTLPEEAAKAVGNAANMLDWLVNKTDELNKLIHGENNNHVVNNNQEANINE